jgi:hypothetical protein
LRPDQPAPFVQQRRNDVRSRQAGIGFEKPPHRLAVPKPYRCCRLCRFPLRERSSHLTGNNRKFGRSRIFERFVKAAAIWRQPEPLTASAVRQTEFRRIREARFPTLLRASLLYRGD